MLVSLTHEWYDGGVTRASVCSCVRQASRRCSRCLMFFLTLFIIVFNCWLLVVSWAHNMVSFVGVVCSLLMCLFTILYILHVVCFIGLLSVFVTCLGVVDVLLLNIMVFFYVWVGYLLLSPCMVFHNVCVCVFRLWSHCYFKVNIWKFGIVFIFCIFGLIFFLMCSSLNVLWILTFGMWCLSASIR